MRFSRLFEAREERRTETAYRELSLPATYQGSLQDELLFLPDAATPRGPVLKTRRPGQACTTVPLAAPCKNCARFIQAHAIDVRLSLATQPAAHPSEPAGMRRTSQARIRERGGISTSIAPAAPCDGRCSCSPTEPPAPRQAGVAASSRYVDAPLSTLPDLMKRRGSGNQEAFSMERSLACSSIRVVYRVCGCDQPSPRAKARASIASLSGTRRIAHSTSSRLPQGNALR